MPIDPFAVMNALLRAEAVRDRAPEERRTAHEERESTEPQEARAEKGTSSR